jgi:hypothetical protein
MLESPDIAWLRLEFAADLATPRVVFEALVHPRCLLNGRNVLPCLIVAWTVSTMKTRSSAWRAAFRTRNI